MSANAQRTIAVVTGTRAEFGLLRPVMNAIGSHPALQLKVIVTGAHLLPPSNTSREVAADFEIAATVPMQVPGQVGRMADAAALGRGITGLAETFATMRPDAVVVLGDRIEAFAAASTAAVAGIRVAHLHGGDRAEGVADESMRHAISKLAHIHLPATPTSAQRLIAMGEEPARVHVVGSPSMDGLVDIAPLEDSLFHELGEPQIVILLHPVGEDASVEGARTSRLLTIAAARGRVLVMQPNHDPGRDGIIAAIEKSGLPHRSHMPRDQFFALLHRVKVIVGNSSSGLIEAAAAPARCLNVGRRQSGREKPTHVIDVPDWDYQTIDAAIERALREPPLKTAEVPHPYGDGRSGQRVAELLATLDLSAHGLRKLNTY